MTDDQTTSETDEKSSGRTPSKSQRKRDAQAFIDLGQRIVELSAPQLLKLPLPLELRSAVDDARKTSAHGAKKRQLKFIGKLLRHVDSEPIKRALAAIEASSEIARLRHQRVERFVRQLLEGASAGALEQIIIQYPEVDRQHLRQLIRSAHNELAHGKPVKSRRILFRYLRELDERLALSEASEQ